MPDLEGKLPRTIGLGCSGGGSCAAGFHLGVLAYLHRVQLLDRVAAISTVSGGTFTGASYALAKADGLGFLEFFRLYSVDLVSLGLIDGVLARVGRGDPPPDVPSGRRTLVTCAAWTYREGLFAAADVARAPRRLGDLLDGDLGNLSEVIFNATDFRSGYAFRFQVSKTGGKIGNNDVVIDLSAAKAIAIGDIVAASSCFPGGFEPIEFPQDFAWPDGVTPANLYTKNRRPEVGVPLMDGGIYDNQGLESLTLASERIAKARARTSNAEKGPGLDWLILSDTAGGPDVINHNQPALIYQMPAPLHRMLGDTWIRFLDLRACWLDVILLAFVASGGLALGLFLGIVWHLLETYGSATLSTWVSSVALSLPLVAAMAAGALALATRRFLHGWLLGQVPERGHAAWSDLKQLRIGELLDLIVLRAGSLIKMASSVFLRRIRSQGYERIYRDRFWRGRVLANYLYHLPKAAMRKGDSGDGNWFFQELKRPGLSSGVEKLCAGVPTPSRRLIEVATAAWRMPLTLWFTEPWQLPALIAAGQVTTCLNLMKQIARSVDVDPVTGRFPGELGDLWELLASDWKQLNEDPYFALKAMRGDEPVAEVPTG